MSSDKTILVSALMLACACFFIAVPAYAFTANSLDIAIDTDGDAVATFRFTLEGLIENAIPQSVLEEELKKGLTTSSEPPELKSMDRSSATLLMKKFAETKDVPTGTEYLTSTMDFKKAEIALESSALSSVVTADFSPARITLQFPDSFVKQYTDTDVLPSVSHTVIDPVKAAKVEASATAASATGATSAAGYMNVTSTPSFVKVYVDGRYLGASPNVFAGISPGIHTVEFKSENYESVSRPVTIVEGKTTNVMVILQPVPTGEEPESTSDGLFWIVLIIAIIVIAGAGYFYWSNKEKPFRNKGEDDDGDDGRRKPVVRDIQVVDSVFRAPDHDVIADQHEPRDNAAPSGAGAVPDPALPEPTGAAMAGDHAETDPALPGSAPAHADPVTAQDVTDSGEMEPETRNTVVRITMLREHPDPDEPAINGTGSTGGTGTKE